MRNTMGLRRGKVTKRVEGRAVVVVRGGGVEATWYPVRENQATRDAEVSLEKTAAELRKAHVAAQDESALLQMSGRRRPIR